MVSTLTQDILGDEKEVADQEKCIVSRQDLWICLCQGQNGDDLPPILRNASMASVLTEWCRGYNATSISVVRENILYLEKDMGGIPIKELAECSPTISEEGCSHVELTSDATKVEGDDDLECHEDLLEYFPFLREAKYWLHGVGVCSVAIFGLVSNILAFVALGPPSRQEKAVTRACKRICCGVGKMMGNAAG